MAREPRRATVVRTLAAAAIVVPIYYIGLVTVLGLLWEGYDPLRDTQSELGAVDSPHAALANFAGFTVVGVAILAFAVAYGLVLHGGSARTAVVILLVVAGAGMLVVGFFPCDADCVDVTQTGRLHGTFSAPGAIGLPAAMMLSSLVFKRDGRFGTAWQAVSFWLGLITLASGPIVATGLAEGALGLLQRAGMWPPLLWMSAVSMRLYALAASLESRGSRS